MPIFDAPKALFIPKGMPLFKKVLIFLGIIFTIFAILLGIAFWLTPINFALAKQDHSHFRMQYIFRGQAEDFGSPRYQVDYVKNICSGALTESPIHFHDNKNQIVHLHWQKVTGGEVLKFYGLNRIGGLDDFMGLKIDDLAKFKFTPLPIHSKSLPKPTGDDKFWVYTGDKNSPQKRTIEDFTSQDIETFLGKNSKVRIDQEEYQKQKSSLEILQKYITGGINVDAHTGIDHANQSDAQKHEAETKLAEQEKANIERLNNAAATKITAQTNIENTSSVVAPVVTDEELKDINNLLGDVIIFVQPSEPTTDQVKARFEALTTLSKSVCGG
jgi:hypothetical protein